MSNIEREEFEQAVTDRWSDSYSFTRFGDEDYYDEVLEGICTGCHRTLEQIGAWGSMTDKERQEAMRELGQPLP